MRVIILLLLLFINLSFSEEETLEKVKIPQEIIHQLDIKTEVIKKKSLTLSKKYPAVVKDDLTLSEAIYSPVSGLVKEQEKNSFMKIRLFPTQDTLMQ